MNSFFRFILRWVGGVLFGLLLIVSVVWLMTRQTDQDKWQAAAAAARTPPPTIPQMPAPVATAPISPKSFQTLIAEVYHVETSRFIQPDLMWVTFSSGEDDVQKKCQGIANLWAVRNGASYFRVECWSGNTRLGQGTVVNGEIRDL